MWSGGRAIDVVPKEPDFLRTFLRTNVLGRTMGEATRPCVPSQGGDIFMQQCHPRHLTYANPANLKAGPLTKLHIFQR